MSLQELPQEIVEEILILCALFNSPGSIASLSQTSRHFRDIVYDTTDNHLWREIYLSTFDDPRPSLNFLRAPVPHGTSQNGVDSDFSAFGWRVRYQSLIQAEKVLRKAILVANDSDYDPNYLRTSFNAILSAVDTALPKKPSLPEEVSLKEFLQSTSSSSFSFTNSHNINWLTECISNGFPPTLVHKLIGESPLKGKVPPSSMSHEVLHSNWDYSEAGKAFYKMVYHTGFRPLPKREWSLERSLFPDSSEFTSLVNGNTHLLVPDRQRHLALSVARRKVYDLPYLSVDRCWGPFLPLQKRERMTKRKKHLEQSELDRLLGSDYQIDDPEEGRAFVQEIMNEFRIFFEELEDSIAPEAAHDDHEADEDDGEGAANNVHLNTDDGGGAASGSTYDTDPYADMHAGHPGVDGDSNTSDSDTESEPSSPSGRSSPLAQLHDRTVPSTTQLRYPLHPEYPHLLQPDYVFLYAARTVVQLNLLERFNATGSVPVWPWFMNEQAVSSTSTLLESSNGLQGLDGLRMGSAPGFWDGINGEERKRGWGMNNFDTNEDETMAGHAGSFPDKASDREAFLKEAKIDLEAERRKANAKDPGLELDDDGWDWAGVEGKWIRAACWMDYRDLLFLNLRVTNDPNEGAITTEDIQETCVVFPMDLIIIGYSHVKPPRSLPSSGATASGASKDKGKGKVNTQDLEEDVVNQYMPSPPYNPLVYTLPVIHVTGKYSGSQHVVRVARGTVRMIGDGAVRWSLVTSDAGTGREEWVMEGVQIGGVGSALGVAGMWTGAMHERSDPLGPTWAWKIA